jgi:hypothetical protein
LRTIVDLLTICSLYFYYCHSIPSMYRFSSSLLTRSWKSALGRLREEIGIKKFNFSFSTTFYVTEFDYIENQGGSSDRPVLDYEESGEYRSLQNREIVASLVLLLPPIV